jgi:23S rRNA pseudouridine2605 synthase
LQKLIARAGLASRREAERWIREGRVTVNGRPVVELGAQADPHTERVQVDGKPLLPSASPAYFVLHKPAGVVTSARDPQGRRDLTEWLSPLRKIGRLFSVGRLDFHSQGLLLLTTDGELAYRLAHPSFGVAKRYQVKIGGIPREEELVRLRTEIQLDDGWTAPASAHVINSSGKKAWIEVEIHEGKNRQVRRMFEALGYRVEKLLRVGYGPVRLGSLHPGEIRPLAPAEVAALKRAVAGKKQPGVSTKGYFPFTTKRTKTKK